MVHNYTRYPSLHHVHDTPSCTWYSFMHMLLLHAHATPLCTCYSFTHMLLLHAHATPSCTCYSFTHMLLLHAHATPSCTCYSSTHMLLLDAHASLSCTCYSFTHMLPLHENDIPWRRRDSFTQSSSLETLKVYQRPTDFIEDSKNVSDKKLGVSEENLGTPMKIWGLRRKLEASDLGVSDGQRGVSKENLLTRLKSSKFSNENLGSLIKSLGSLMKILAFNKASQKSGNFYKRQNFVLYKFCYVKISYWVQKIKNLKQ